VYIRCLFRVCFSIYCCMRHALWPLWQFVVYFSYWLYEL